MNRSDIIAPNDKSRVLPHSADAEQAVLGAMMIGGPEVIEEAQSALATDAFFVPAHQILFDTIISLHGSGHAFDLITFTQMLRDAGYIENVGGTIEGESGPGNWYVTRLHTLLHSTAMVLPHMEIVKEKWLARQMIATCTEAVRQAYEEQDRIHDALDALQGNVIELGNLRETKDPLQHIREFVPEALAQIKAAYANRGEVTGLPTGFIDFDRMTNGLEKGYNYVIAARPAMGKTSFGLGLAEYIAVENAKAGNVVQIFSLEMTGVQLARRLIGAAASVSLSQMRYGFLEKDDIPRAERAAERLIKSHILVDDKTGLNIMEFRARARRAVIKRKAKLIIIDYLGMMHGVSRRARENRQLEVSECIQGIAETAKELQVPIVTLAQLNRGAEDRKWGIPEMSDIRESGDIENYAHLVGMLWRPEYYAKTEKQREALADYLGKSLATEADAPAGVPLCDWNPPEGWSPPVERLDGFAQVIITKQREGATGPCPLRFVKEYARFESATEKLFSNNPNERQMPHPASRN